MPLTSLTCPNCLAVLKPAKPIPDAARVKCPKCKGVFTAKPEPEPEAAETDGQESEPSSRAKAGTERKKMRDEISSRDAPSRRSGRPNRVEDEPSLTKKRIAARQEASRESLRRDLMPAAIALGVGGLFWLPMIFIPLIFFAYAAVAAAIGIFGFVTGCLRAGREGYFVAFDYLAFLGPLRWLVAVGFFALYLFGYLTLWTIAQISCAIHKPRAMLPAFSLQAVAFLLIFPGVIVAGFLNDFLSGARIGPSPAPPVVAGPVTPAPPVLKTDPEPEAEPPALTGDRETDRLLARVGGKNPGAVRDAASRLAVMQPNQHQSVVAKILADDLQTADAAIQPALIRALCVWATVDQAPILIRYLSDGDAGTRNEVLKVIGKMRDDRAVDPAILCLENLQTSYNAEQALKEMGPVAETGLLAVLNQPTKKAIWNPVIRILKEIGTEKSIPTLEAASQGDFSIRGSAQGALDAVRKRVKK